MVEYADTLESQRSQRSIHTSCKCGVRVQGRREEPDIETLCPQSTPQELPVMGKDGDGKYAYSRSLVTTSPRLWSETQPARREHPELQSYD